MNALLFLAATAVVGVDVGWQPLSDGGVEYIIQIEPQLLDTLSKSHDLSSDLPAGLDVRRFRITVGTAQLPREMPVAPLPRSSAGSTSKAHSPPPPVAAQAPPAADPGTVPQGPVSSGAIAAPGAVAGPASAGSRPIAQPPAALGSPSPVAPPAAVQPPPASVASPPIGAATPADIAPPVALAPIPAIAPPVADAQSGPDLEPPAAFARRQRAAVSSALDDPNAPGRNPAGETAQPQLPTNDLIAGPRPPRTLDPDPASGQLAEYKATPHEAQRPSEREGNQEHRGGVQGGSEHPAAEHAAGAPPADGHPTHEVAKSPAGADESAPKPWGPLTAVALLLLISVSANVYMGWVAWDSRTRYRDLLADHGGMPMTA